jgi:hypothetical protein
MARLEIDIDWDDVYDDLASWEKQLLCNQLYEDGYDPAPALPTEGYSPDEEIYREAVAKLLDCYSQLSAAQAESVIQLAGHC